MSDQFHASVDLWRNNCPVPINLGPETDVEEKNLLSLLGNEQ
jgi:hypothetical protein